MTNISDVMYNKDDVGKNLYRKKTYYTLVVEQDVLANDKDEADKKFLECGIDHSKITTSLTEEKDGVETYMVDANYTDSDNTKYMGKVKYDTETIDQSFDDAVENGDVFIDTYADEDEPHQLTKIKLVTPMTPEEEYKNAGVVIDNNGNAMGIESMYGTKEESDVDVAIQLQAENERGK